MNDLYKICNSQLSQLDSPYKLNLIVYINRMSALVYRKLEELRDLDVSVEEFSDEEKEVCDRRIELEKLEQYNQKSRQEMAIWKKEFETLNQNRRMPRMRSEILSQINSEIRSRSPLDDVKI